MKEEADWKLQKKENKTLFERPLRRGTKNTFASLDKEYLIFLLISF